MACNWSKGDYLAQLMCRDHGRSHSALEMLVNDLHSAKEKTVLKFLCHSGSEDFLWQIVRLLGNDIPRVAGNAAYIIGTLAESELGCYRIISLAKSCHPESRNILPDLSRMLTFDDPESVMNAAGTLGTMAESAEGREWMLSEACLESMLDHVTNLLHNENLWTASNAALVLARLSISEQGCSFILKHPHSQHILTCLIHALGVDEAGRGMNAAFAVGRLCDTDAGRQSLLNFPNTEEMITSLVQMLSCEDAGASKNACFALSCLAASPDGHSCLLNNTHSEKAVKTLSQLLSVRDSETGWFAAMTLRTLASQPKGCKRLRELPEVDSALKEAEQLVDVNSDLKEEVLITLQILRPLDPPEALMVIVESPNKICAKWNKSAVKSGFDVWYQLFEDSKCIYSGSKCQCDVNMLLPNKTYSFRVRAVNEIETSAFSEAATVTTDEDLPEAPHNLRILGSTATQLKVGWSPPDNFHGISKGYYIYLGKTMVEHTMDLSAILSGLASNTAYDIQVCAATVKGKGPRVSCTGHTSELGAHAPGKPHVQVLGRNEVHITWEPPEMPMGRITRYDVSMNGSVIYSGTELSCGAHRLTPDTEYSFVVTALTNEGKFESKPTKKRTSKDEFDPDRPPLYQPPKREEEPQKPTHLKKRKSVTDIRAGRVQSAKGSITMGSSDRAVTAGGIVNTHGPVMKHDKGKEDSFHLSIPTQKARSTNHDASSKKESVNLRVNKEQSPSASTRRSSFSTLESHNLSSSIPALKTYSSHNSELFKPSPSVAVSYVSVNVRQDHNFQLNALGHVSPNNHALTQSLPFYSSGNPTLRMEQSRTTLNHSNLRSSRNCKLEKFDSNDPKHKDWFQLHSPDTINQPFNNTHDLRLSLPAREKLVFLPKPTIPSSHYLEGSRSCNTSSGTPGVLRSLPSQGAFTDQQIEQAEEMKKAITNHHYHPARRKDGEQSSLVYMAQHMRADYHDKQREFIHRTNTFTESHRPIIRKTYAKNAPTQSTRAASISLTENSLLPSTPHNRFVPVQLRTQPNHLTASQLQRVNTTLYDTGRGDLQDGRIDVLVRSNTQNSMRLQPQANGPNNIGRLEAVKREVQPSV